MRSSLIALAAQWLVDRKADTWHDDAREKNKLARFLSDRIRKSQALRVGARASVAINWVTRNRAAIERRRLDLA